MKNTDSDLVEVFSVVKNDEGKQTWFLNKNTIEELIAQQHTKNQQMMGDEQYLRDFLSPSVEERDTFAFVNESKHYHDYESSIKRYCLLQILERDFTLDETCWIDSYGSKTSARWATSEIYRDVKTSIPKMVYFFATNNNDNSKWVFRVETWEDLESQLTIYTNESQDCVNEVWEALNDYFNNNCPLKGEFFTPSWKYVKGERRTWDDLALSKDLRENIMLHIVDFFNHLEKYGEYGLSKSRGVILAGKPGTGKTLTVDIIANEFSNHTRIYATAETLMSRHGIRDMYKMARLLSPTIVFIEDIDTIGSSDDDDSYRTPLIGEILTALNSVESNDGVLTIATTNYPDALDIALRDRPGRFDARIDYPLPDKTMRKNILLKMLKPFKFQLNGKDLTKIVSATNDFTGAWISELIQLAFAFALRKNPDSPDINMDCLDEAIRTVKQSRSTINQHDTDQNTVDLY